MSTPTYNKDEVFKFLFGAEYNNFTFSQKEIIQTELKNLHIGVIVPIVKIENTILNLKWNDYNINSPPCNVPEDLKTTLKYTINKMDSNNQLTTYNNGTIVLYNNNDIQTFMADVSKLITNLNNDKKDTGDKIFAGGNNKSHTKKQRNKNNSKSRKSRQ